MLRIGSVLGLTVLLSGCISEFTQGPPKPWSATFPDVSVAPDDLVRVVTPFAEPRVVTTSSAEIERSQNVLYVLTTDRDPITMFITDSANESSSINLALTSKTWWGSRSRFGRDDRSSHRSSTPRQDWRTRAFR